MPVELTEKPHLYARFRLLEDLHLVEHRSPAQGMRQLLQRTHRAPLDGCTLFASRRHLSSSSVVLNRIPKRRDFPQTRPIITRSRTWRGQMLARFDDTGHDRKKMLLHIFLYSPSRVFGTFCAITFALYAYYGHDQFMFQVFGYESESFVEGRVNELMNKNILSAIGTDKAAFSPVRKLEPKKDYKAVHGIDIFQEGKQ